jgi:site-specific DNA-methyltransferase (adenine-specific)
MGYHYRARYEFVLFFEKGKRRLNDLGVADVLSIPRVHRGYPAEKPPAVSEILINQSTEAGQIVADPFMGSGSVGVAALKLGRRFIGTDLNPEAVQLTASRLREFGQGVAPSDECTDSPRDLLSLIPTVHER